jgi:ATP-binding cassette subfamily B protein RaxB
MLQFGSRHRVEFVGQDEASECGLACLAMVAASYGHAADLRDLRHRFSPSLKGATLDELIKTAEKLGFNCRPVRADLDELVRIALPAVLHWNLNHFVVLHRVSRGVRGTRFHVHDPARGSVELSSEQVSPSFTGIALELFPGEEFKRVPQPPRLRLSQLWSSARGVWPSLGNVLALSVLLQLAALAGPFYLQSAVDNALPSADRNLVSVLALGFLGLCVFSFLTTWLRSNILIYVSNTLSYQLTVNLFRHLFKLPLTWFERRHIGDVASRFGSTRALSEMLSHGMIAAIIDAAMAISTMAMMFFFSAKLALVALVALLVYGVLRASFLYSLRASNANAITADARENSLFLESIRGVSAIKAFGYEDARQRHWQRSKADAVNAQVKIQRMSAGFDAGNQLVLGLERVIFVLLAIGMAMDGLVTLGMIFAFQAYKQSFLDASCRLVDQMANVAVLRLHLSRVADIALERPESMESESSLLAVPDIVDPPCIELRNVSYSYGAGEACVLYGVSLRIEPGQSVVLVGPSGGGKTTLLKIMMGLIRPTAGEVLINGVPMNAFGLARWRQMCASVAQDDTLFAGSLAENIGFFSPTLDMERVREAARTVGIAGDIARMPMGYSTLVGDMGSVLSAGQKQRVLMARAIYKRPTALFVDEGTAHLDVQSELQLLKALGDLAATRISVAHRPAAVVGRGRVFQVVDGLVREVELSRKLSPIATFEAGR